MAKKLTPAEQLKNNVQNYNKQIRTGAFSLSNAERRERGKLQAQAKALRENADAVKAAVESDEKQIADLQNVIRRDKETLKDLNNRIDVFVLEPETMKQELDSKEKALAEFRKVMDGTIHKLEEKDKDLSEKLQAGQTERLSKQKAMDQEIQRLEEELSGYKFYELKKKSVIKGELSRLTGERDLIAAEIVEIKQKYQEQYKQNEEELNAARITSQKTSASMEKEIDHLLSEINEFRNRQLPQYQKLLAEKEQVISGIKENTDLIGMLEHRTVLYCCNAFTQISFTRYIFSSPVVSGLNCKAFRQSMYQKQNAMSFLIRDI